MRDLVTGAVVSLPLAWIVWRRGAVTPAGAAVGVIFAGVIYAGMYLAGLAVLLVALLLTLASSRAGLQAKTAAGIAEEHGGRRGAPNVIANCLIGTGAAALEAWFYGFGSDLNGALYVAAIAAGASDTVASEIGKAWGGTPRSFPTWRRVPAGTPGAISLAGTAAGVAAAALIAAPAVLLFLIPVRFVLPIVAASMVAAFVESTLATRFGRRILSTHALNLINTSTAAFVAVLFCRP
jgi:uncharacterized protein (TIGR00297 family)